MAKRQKEDRKKDRIAVKPKSADNYVGRPNEEVKIAIFQLSIIQDVADADLPWIDEGDQCYSVMLISPRSKIINSCLLVSQLHKFHSVYRMSLSGSPERYYP